VQQWPFARSVAIVSDIHEPVRESVLEAVSQVDLILHAGDVYDLTAIDNS
jgi:predicted phosphodiesterase